MDWQEDDFTAGFVFANPNAKGAAAAARASRSECERRRSNARCSAATHPTRSISRPSGSARVDIGGLAARAPARADRDRRRARRPPPVNCSLRASPSTTSSRARRTRGSAPRRWCRSRLRARAGPAAPRGATACGRAGAGRRGAAGRGGGPGDAAGGGPGGGACVAQPASSSARQWRAMTMLMASSFRWTRWVAIAAPSTGASRLTQRHRQQRHDHAAQQDARSSTAPAHCQPGDGAARPCRSARARAARR